MKKFLTYFFLRYVLTGLAVFSLILILAMQRFELKEDMLASAYKEEIESYKWVRNVDSVCGFIMGSSSLRYGLSSNAMKRNDSNWINFSMDARDPIVFYLLLKKYFFIKRPKTVLVGLDPWIYTKRYYIYRSPVMYLDLNLSETISLSKENPSIISTKVKEILNQYLVHRESIGTQRLTKEIPEDFGSGRLLKTAQNFNQISADWFQIESSHWSSLQFNYLNRIKEFCRDHRVELVFILPPKRYDFIEWSRTEYKREHQQWWKLVEPIIKGEKIIGNYSFMRHYPQNDVFIDAFHLNPFGQKEFSSLVKKHLGRASVVNTGYHIF